MAFTGTVGFCGDPTPFGMALSPTPLAPILAPHIAGVAALLASANRLSTPLRIRSVVESTAVSLADRGMGQGLADAAAALRSTSSPRSEVLDLINSAEFATLVTRFGLLAFTARVLISRRPFADIAQLRVLPGLTPEQYSSIANIRADPTPALALPGDLFQASGTSLWPHQ
jgi:hypothetical protein